MEDPYENTSLHGEPSQPTECASEITNMTLGLRAEEDAHSSRSFDKSTVVDGSFPLHLLSDDPPDKFLEHSGWHALSGTLEERSRALAVYKLEHAFAG